VYGVARSAHKMVLWDQVSPQIHTISSTGRVIQRRRSAWQTQSINFRVFRLVAEDEDHGDPRGIPHHPVECEPVIRSSHGLNVTRDHPQPTIMASQAKDRHSAQLARSLTGLNQTIGQTKSLLKQFSTDLDAMRTLTAIHVSQCASLVSFTWFQSEMELSVDS